MNGRLIVNVRVNVINNLNKIERNTLYSPLLKSEWHKLLLIDTYKHGLSPADIVYYRHDKHQRKKFDLNIRELCIWETLDLKLFPLLRPNIEDTVTIDIWGEKTRSTFMKPIDWEEKTPTSDIKRLSQYWWSDSDLCRSFIVE